MRFWQARRFSVWANAMPNKIGTYVDFIAKGETPDTWRMVLVEEGPWNDIEVELRRVQNRLYDCLDAALDGQLLEKFPATKDKVILIQLDGYNLPEQQISNLFNSFSKNIFEIEDYANALNQNKFVNGIKFKLNLSQS